MIRFLLLHSKSDSPEEIMRQVEKARSILPRFTGLHPFEITTGRDHFERAFKAAGSWDAWAQAAGGGVHPLTREPLFHGYLVPTLDVGAGTARIVAVALARKKPVLAFGEGESFARVHWVARADPKDWKQGFRIGIGPYRAGTKETESHA